MRFEQFCALVCSGLVGLWWVGGVVGWYMLIKLRGGWWCEFRNLDLEMGIEKYRVAMILRWISRMCENRNECRELEGAALAVFATTTEPRWHCASPAALC